MNMQRILVAILLLANAVMIFVFIDGLNAVGRYDAGIKLLILQLPYISIALSVYAIFILENRKIARITLILALIGFLPLFLHECLPGIIGLIDPSYRQSIDGINIVPFMRFDITAFAIVAVFLAVIFALSIKRPNADRGY